MNHSTPGLPVCHRLPEFTQTHVHWIGDAIQPSHPLSSPSPPAFNLSQHQGLFKWVSSASGGQSNWSFSFNISPSNEHPGLISFRMDWSELLAVQGTLKSLLQRHSSKGKLLGMFNVCEKTFMKYNKYEVSQCQHVILRIWASPFRCVGHSFPTSWGLDRDCCKHWGFASLCIFNKLALKCYFSLWEKVLSS